MAHYKLIQLRKLIKINEQTNKQAKILKNKQINKNNTNKGKKTQITKQAIKSMNKQANE